MDLKSKYYIVKKYGGWSPCIQGNNEYGQRPFTGSVLPNCVGFAWGWWHEICHLKDFPFWRKGNARTIYANLRDQGCVTSTVPAYGAMMVWDDGVAGHVAIVNEIRPDGSVCTLESGWKFTGNIVQEYVRSGEDWRKGCRWMVKSYKFLGFVYHPCLPVITSTRYRSMDDGTIITLPTVYLNGRNYPQLSALADAGLLRASWDSIVGLPEIGKAK